MSAFTFRSRLYVICDLDACERAGWTLVDFAAACFDGGARLLQIRAKTAPAGWLLEQTDAIVALAALADHADVIVNDRADIARLAGVAGVHVGQDDLPPDAVRRVVGDDVAIGFSTHTEAQIAEAISLPISYLAVGPIFGTASKNTGYEAVGLDRVQAARRAADRCGLPVAAIGGITLNRAADVIRAGADTVAVIGDMFVGDDPAQRVRDFLDRLSTV